MRSAFEILNSINVSEHIEKKGQFSYLSWPFAVAQLRQADAAAIWEVVRFDGLPYQKTEVGYFVEVAVTVQGVRLSQVHPVLDQRNRPIDAPTCFEINSSIMRCLVKAIALHGLGLSVYAGEDLPEAEKAPSREKQEKKEFRPVQQPQVPAATLSGEQIAKVKALLAETGTALQRLLAFFRVESLEKIPAAEYERVLQTLQQAKRRAA